MTDPTQMTSTEIHAALRTPDPDEIEDPEDAQLSSQDDVGVIDSDAPPFDQDGNPIWQ